MWFDFGSPTLARFWMHRTPEPLDMLFIRDQRVVAIEAHAKPCDPAPGLAASLFGRVGLDGLARRLGHLGGQRSPGLGHSAQGACPGHGLGQIAEFA
jgi:hypothetical protein